MDMKKATGIVILAAVVFFANASANNINSGGEKGLIRTMTTETHGLGAITLGGAIKYDIDEDYAIGPNGQYNVLNTKTNTIEQHDFAQLFSGDLYLVYGLHSAWDIGIDLPMYHDKTGWDQDHTDKGNL